MAAVIALVLAGAPIAVAHADTLPVTTCADDGSPGTLRAVMASAHDGDTIDMTQLTCGTITLAQGLIATDRAGLTLAGPGREALTISGGGVSRVFYAGSYANSVFTVRDLTIAHGHEEPELFERSACLSGGTGALVLERVDITDCHSYFSDSSGERTGGAVAANVLTMIDSTITASSLTEQGSATSSAQGGGAWAAQATLIRSTISGNTATARSGSRYGGGGGLWAGNLVMVDSVVTGNTTVATDPGEDSVGGGVVAYQNATVLRSLIANNSADGNGGGLFKWNLANTGRAAFTIQNSTIAGNYSGGTGGALLAYWPPSIANSTIAGNTSAEGSAVRLDLYWLDFYGNLHVRGWPDFESTIIAGNLSGPTSDHADLTIDAPVTVFGSHDFIGDADPAITLPPDTLRGDPYLNPLADNGGRSETMAPMMGSPVINYGANALGFVVDQRGPGFPRVVGAAADIGAYEVQSSPVPQAIRQPEPVNPVIATNHVPTVLPVTSCADDGSQGTLRSVAAQALDGDTLDLTGLTCSTITLTQGPIAIGLLGPNLVHTLTINGPGAAALTVSGNGASAVFLLGAPNFYGIPGTVTLSNLTVADGAKYDTAACVASFSAYVVLDHVVVSACHTNNAGGGSWLSGHGGGAVSGFNVQAVDSTISDSSVTAVDRNVASGGGLWALNNMTLTNSAVSGNSVVAPVQDAGRGYASGGTDYQTAGGGVYTMRSVVLIGSTISGNTVTATEAGENANGGGAFTLGGYQVAGATFENNVADGAGGGLFSGSSRTPYEELVRATYTDANITNSTFSGNRAFAGGAMATQSTAAAIANSTIAGNYATQGGGLTILWSGTGVYDPAVHLDSTIIAGNAAGDAATHTADLAAASNLEVTVIGSNNLVGSADTNVTLPPDTIDSDPRLLPLADNGGPTWTMALASGSPAINAGNNAVNVPYDQRGAGFSRVVGIAADIGAYEVQSFPDVIFASGFDD